MNLAGDLIDTDFSQSLDVVHRHLRVLATSKLSWLPRFTFMNLGGWISVVDPQSRFDKLAKVTTLGSEGDALQGKISPIAAALHPFDDFKPSTFTSICVEKIDRTPPTHDGTIDSPHPSLTWSMTAALLLSFLVWVGALSYAIFCEETEAILVVSSMGVYNSFMSYMLSWRPSREEGDPAALDELRKREAGDVMIYTEEGALILVKCSPQVAEELYFNFPTYATRPILPDDISSKMFIFLFGIGFVWTGGFMYEFLRIFLYKSCSATCLSIMFYVFACTVTVEMIFGALPADFRWDVSRYYWVDITPQRSETKKTVEEGKRLADMDNNATEERNRLSGVDEKFLVFMLSAFVSSADYAWLTYLNVPRQTGKQKEAKLALLLTGCVLNKRSTRLAADLVLIRAVASVYRDQMESGQELLMYRLIDVIFKAAIRRRRKKTERKRPDRLSFHISTASRQLGYSYHPVNIAKLLFEYVFDRQLSWYPFSESTEMRETNRVRIYSLDPKNPRKARFHYDMPAILADDIFNFPFQKALAVKEDVVYESPKVFLHGASIIQLLIDYTESQRSSAPKTTTANVSPSGDSNAGPSQATEQQQSASSNANAPPDESSRKTPVPDGDEGELKTEGQSTDAPSPEPDDRDGDSLFVCADIATHESRARVMKLGINDRGTIDQLRSTYHQLSSKLPRIKRITGIRFFRFHSFLQREIAEDKEMLIHIHKDAQRYPLKTDPEYHEYRYSPRPWPAALPFPDREICWYFLHPEDCGTSSSLNKMLPARVGDDLVTHRRAFGIYIEEAYSLWAIFLPVVGLSTILLGVTLWFIRYHTDDLQTAIVPFTVASSIGTLVINVGVSLLLFRMLAP